jgi:hypothetical protein
VARPVSDVPLVHVGDGTDELKDHHAGLRFIIRPSERERERRGQKAGYILLIESSTSNDSVKEIST